MDERQTERGPKDVLRPPTMARRQGFHMTRVGVMHQVNHFCFAGEHRFEDRSVRSCGLHTPRWIADEDCSANGPKILGGLNGVHQHVDLASGFGCVSFSHLGHGGVGLDEEDGRSAKQQCTKAENPVPCSHVDHGSAFEIPKGTHGRQPLRGEVAFGGVLLQIRALHGMWLKRGEPHRKVPEAHVVHQRGGWP